VYNLYTQFSVLSLDSYLLLDVLQSIYSPIYDQQGNVGNKTPQTKSLHFFVGLQANIR